MHCQLILPVRKYPNKVNAGYKYVFLFFRKIILKILHIVQERLPDRGQIEVKFSVEAILKIFLLSYSIADPENTIYWICTRILLPRLLLK